VASLTLDVQDEDVLLLETRDGTASHSRSTIRLRTLVSPQSQEPLLKYTITTTDPKGLVVLERSEALRRVSR
jgi:hypothetical protein